MKIHKMVCIDQELNEKLEGLNASSLVNKLLTEHFEMAKPKTKEEMVKRLEFLKLQEKHKKELAKYEWDWTANKQT